MDNEGFLYFISRKDDLIKCRGERVSPKEIEDFLCTIDGVAESAVIGTPDDLLGQAIKAFIVLRNGSSITEKSIIQACTRGLESFMVPKSVVFCQSLPKSPNGKIDKKCLH
jgi:acyl-coenzyme A synthetase/AMP-(fatty) acid ligase